MFHEILVNRYQIKKKLSQRNGRQTLLALDLNTQNLVIIKLLSFGNNFEWDDLKLFEREAKTLKNLKHQAIPKYLDYFEINTNNVKGFALVQTYIKAKNLEEYIKSGRHFTEKEIKDISRQVLEILIYIHQQNPSVIHRDIKPSNILLGDRTGNSVGKIYLIDFGSVQTTTATEIGTRTVVGTYGYMPQEQFGDRTVPASDIYSLGATLIYLITGIHPADLPQKDFRIQFAPINTLSPQFIQWLHWVTEPKVEERLDSAQKTLEVLEARKINIRKEKIPTFLTYKPVSSKIKISKSQDYLEILVPPKDLSPSIIFSSLGIMIWNLLICFWSACVIYFTTFPINLIFILVSILFVSFGAFTIYKLIFTLFGYFQLSLENQEFAIAEGLFGITLDTKQLHSINIIKKYKLFGLSFTTFAKQLNTGITKLSYVPKYRLKTSKDTINNHFRELDEMSSELMIRSGLGVYRLMNTDKYSLGAISKSEIEWLTYELSNWLGIPITREKEQRLS